MTNTKFSSFELELSGGKPRLVLNFDEASPQEDKVFEGLRQLSLESRAVYTALDDLLVYLKINGFCVNTQNLPAEEVANFFDPESRQYIKYSHNDIAPNKTVEQSFPAVVFRSFAKESGQITIALDSKNVTPEFETALRNSLVSDCNIQPASELSSTAEIKPTRR